MSPVDPFAAVNHPWQPLMVHLHLWTAPVLVFTVGLIWQGHAWTHLRRGVRRRRRSGLLLIGAMAPMVASGYFIQTAVDETWRTAWVVVHLVTSGSWLVAYLIHQLTSRHTPTQSREPRQSGRRALRSG